MIEVYTIKWIYRINTQWDNFIQIITFPFILLNIHHTKKKFQIKHFYVQYKCLHVKHNQHNHKYLTEDKADIVVKYIYIYIYLCIYLFIYIYVPKVISLRKSHSTKYYQNPLGSFRTRTDAKLPDKWAYMTSQLCCNYTLCIEMMFSLHAYL